MVCYLKNNDFVLIVILGIKEDLIEEKIFKLLNSSMVFNFYYI